MVLKWFRVVAAAAVVVVVTLKYEENDDDALHVVNDDWKEESSWLLAPFIIIELLLFPVFIDSIVSEGYMVGHLHHVVVVVDVVAEGINAPNPHSSSSSTAHESRRRRQ